MRTERTAWPDVLFGPFFWGFPISRVSLLIQPVFEGSEYTLRGSYLAPSWPLVVEDAHSFPLVVLTPIDGCTPYTKAIRSNVLLGQLSTASAGWLEATVIQGSSHGLLPRGVCMEKAERLPSPLCRAEE